jgi:tetratricopeptide (TPR) repeat protein
VCLAHGEALARAGDPHGAAAAFRRALAVAPTGPTAVDAALALLRIAATDPAADPTGLSEAMQGLATACADDDRLAANAAREAALVRAAVGTADAADAVTAAPADAPLRVRADMAIVNWLAGARVGAGGAVAEALLDMVQMARECSATGEAPPWAGTVLARAAARARLAGLDAADPVARRVWELERSAALAPALTDLPAPPDGAWPAERPDPRRARARRIGGQLGVALELDVALDAERRGQLAMALSLYGAVIGVDPERLEAWTGIRRVARAGGDVAGEARALARMAAVVRDPEQAASLLAEAAAAYERAGRIDDAVTALAKCIELRPADSAAYLRAHGLLRTDLDVPGRAELFDALLSHRLAAAPMTTSARVALLFERGQHRLLRLANRDAAFADFKEILKIQPEHREALHQLARGALEDRDAESAAHWLVQFLAAAADDPRAPDARLDLAAAYEALKERARAVDTLRRAAASRPGDPKPLQRLSDLQLRLGEWRSAIETLQASEARLPDTASRAALHLRIGSILRDLGRDAPNAAQSFLRAAELDPFSGGTGALVALYDAAGDARGGLDTVLREVADIRRALAADPLDLRRAKRLAEYLALARNRGASAPIVEAEAAVASVLQLIQDQLPPPRAQPWNRMRPFVPTAARAFWAELAHPAAGGFAGEVWPQLVEAALLLFPPPSPRGRRATAAGAADPRFAWIEASAVALGVTGLQIYLGREPGPAVVAVEDPAPGLVLAPDVEGMADAPFHVGRALGVLVQRATVLERVSADDVAPLFACAAIAAGVPPPAGLPKPSEELLRTVMRGIGRKEKKALMLQASRFAFESFDLTAWHEGVLRTADRLGLMMAGDDVARAAQALAGGEAAAVGDHPSAPAASVATDPAALDLVRYALSEQYAALRRSVDDAARARAAGKVPR